MWKVYQFIDAINLKRLASEFGCQEDAERHAREYIQNGTAAHVIVVREALDMRVGRSVDVVEVQPPDLPIAEDAEMNV